MTTTPEGLPAWLHVGAEVGTYSNVNGGSHARTAIVERFTKTQVVLDDGQRFSTRNAQPNAAYLSRSEGGAWGWSVYLTARDSDQFRRVAAAQRVANLRHNARAAVDAWERRPSDETARAAITALEATLTTTEATP